MATYAYIDVSQKQEFIYRHNQLKDNLYNSFIIKSITEDIEFSEERYTNISLRAYLEEHFPREYEFLFSGGGNSIIQFIDRETAQQFVKDFSQEVLKAYPYLELYISLVDMENKEEQAKEIRRSLHAKADQLKDTRRAKFRRWTYGIEKIDETGQAVLWDDTNKQREYEFAREYLYQNLKEILKKEAPSVKITTKLQDYKKEQGGKSYIGVIVIDGNKMGEMVNRITSFEDLRNFSEAIESIYRTAVIEALKSCNRMIDNKGVAIWVTPIVMAGDDICLIIEAEYALETAAMIVQNIQALSQLAKYRSVLQPYMRDMDGYLTACAGVAIARYNYPFFEAVQVAEGLCQRAKESIHNIKTETDGLANASCIDWEIVQGQVSTTHRYEDYVKHEDYKELFHIKPLRLDQQETIKDEMFSYAAFMNISKKILQQIKEEKISQSFLEEVKKVMYAGREQYQLFFEMKQTESSANLVRIVHDVLHEDERCRFAALVRESDTGQEHLYILNDVLHTLPFIANYQEEEIDALKSRV